ncbi:MAG: LCP family protein [Clostridia bacterium]|nr:LCP family protein [Clostridia bacterium]
MNGAENTDKKGKPIARFFWTNKRRRAKNLYFILALLVVVFALGIGYVNAKLSKIQYEDPKQQNPTEYFADEIYDDEQIDIINSINSAGSLNDYLYKWANNGGALYSSKNVINVLLIGLDSADALENGGRSDTLILLSLNKKTKKINMTSFFRDTWTYINVRGRDTYGKINSSYFFGGPETLIETIQNDFKLKIDYYVAVDFSSFTDIINALGGLTIEVEQYEADYINRTTVHNIEAGPAVKLDGWEALVYARIRKSDSDSDVSRTRRQRKVIMALMESAKGAGVAQLNSALDMLFKYVKTDLTRMEILSYGVQGLTNGWLNYEVQQTTIADDDVFKTGYVGSASVVFIDFELAAQRIQTAIYGDSNITLADDRVIPFRLVSRIS